MSREIDRVLQNFFRLCEAAEVLGVTRVTVWHWIKDGKIKGHRLGREVWIEKKAVEALR